MFCHCVRVLVREVSLSNTAGCEKPCLQGVERMRTACHFLPPSSPHLLNDEHLTCFFKEAGTGVVEGANVRQFLLYVVNVCFAC